MTKPKYTNRYTYRDSLLAELEQRGEYTPPVHSDSNASGSSHVRTSSQSQPSVYSDTPAVSTSSVVPTRTHSPVRTFNDSEHVVGVPVAPVPTTPVANQIPVGYDSNLFKSYYRIDPSAIIPGLPHDILNTSSLRSLVFKAIVRNLHEVSGLVLDTYEDLLLINRLRSFSKLMIDGRAGHAFRRLLNYAATIPELRASLLGLGKEKGAALERALAGHLFKAMCAAGAQAEMTLAGRGTDIAPLVLALMRGIEGVPALQNRAFSKNLLSIDVCARLFYGADYKSDSAMMKVSNKGDNEHTNRLHEAIVKLVQEPACTSMFTEWITFAEEKFNIVNKGKIREAIKLEKQKNRNRDPYQEGFIDDYKTIDWFNTLQYIILSSKGKTYLSEIRALRVKLLYLNRRINAELAAFNKAAAKLISEKYLSKEILYNISANATLGMFEQLIKDGVIDQKTGSMINLDVETYLDEQYNRT